MNNTLLSAAFSGFPFVSKISLRKVKQESPVGTTPRAGATGRANSSAHPAKGPITRVEGQIVKVSDRVVTVSGPHGQTASYTVATNAKITKWMPGKFSDLAIGVQVQAVIAGTKTASITILNG